MLSKRSIIVALAGLNLLLLAGVILASYAPPAAMAQAPGRAGDYLMTTCQVHADYDALAIIHVQKGIMLVAVPRETPNGAKLTATGMRNLGADFRR